MDNNTLNRLMFGISVLWLVIIIVRLVFYSSYLSYSESGRTFAMILNVVLLIGLVLMGYILVRRYYPYMASKVDREGRCPYCYGKVERGAEFCPGCGAELKK